jgi:transcription antitermination factor NusG
MPYYVLKTAPGKEQEAKRILERIGYSVDLPIERHWRRGAGGKRQLREVVLMSRYLFVRTDALNLFHVRNLHCRNGLPIITGYIARTDGQPYSLGGEIVQRLMSLVTSRSAEYHKSLKVGDSVTTKQGVTGRIVGTKGQQAEVLTNLLGKMHVVSVSFDKLEAA